MGPQLKKGPSYRSIRNSNSVFSTMGTFPLCFASPNSILILFLISSQQPHSLPPTHPDPCALHTHIASTLTHSSLPSALLPISPPAFLTCL
ncbi:hypothetical protein PILCRDRAFT_702748 [Piloderma croceum F 1598]|uniref:Uncharacterized protein n=1 Tax=Piloderma croceum (strain F 1598) TaxID=765440 RepID=A0A0C3F3F8_PILCF|nr:hypothetical protein PILCRDRAFT_702748 [Piloderma croceum F 1598]